MKLLYQVKKNREILKLNEFIDGLVKHTTFKHGNIAYGIDNVTIIYIYKSIKKMIIKDKLLTITQLDKDEIYFILKNKYKCRDFKIEIW